MPKKPIAFSFNTAAEVHADAIVYPRSVDEVVAAVAAGTFHIYPIATIDEGIEVLTGIPAGLPNAKGQYPKGTVNRLVHDRLARLAEKRRELDAKNGNEESKPKPRRKRTTTQNVEGSQA